MARHSNSASDAGSAGLLAMLICMAGLWQFTAQAVAAQQSEKIDNLDLQFEDEKPQNVLRPARTLSLRECFERAQNNNRELATARENLPIARAAIQIAGAIPNPHFSLQYGWGPQFNIIIAGNPQQFGFLFDLQTAGKRSKQIALASSNQRVSALQLAQLRFDLHNRVRRAYAEQAAAEAYDDLVEAQRKVALQLVKVARTRYLLGKAPRSELLQAQLGVMQFDTLRNQAQARLQQSSSALSLIIGELPQRVEVIDVDDNGIFKLQATKTDIVPAPERPLPALAQLLPAAYSQRPDLKVAWQQRFSDRKALTLAKAQRIPDLFVDSGYQFTTFKRHQPFGLVGSSPAGLEYNTPNSPGCYLNVSFETPIFYQHQGEVEQARATWLQDNAQLKQLEAQIALEIIQAYESVAGAQANIYQYQKELIPEASTIARQARRRYEVGKADLAGAVLARQQYQQILQSYFDAVVAYQNAWADLEKSMGVSLQL